MKVFLDTNVLIYILEGDSEFGLKYAQFLTKLRADGAIFNTSTTTIVEFLASNSDANAVKQLLNFPGLDFYPLDNDAAIKAGDLARKHSIKLGDSIQLATAIDSGCEALISNDSSLTKTAKQYLKILSP
jgi:predicted nucleic acid-binding protein